MNAIIFDLDGTLIDSAPAVQAALNQTLADTGYAPLSAAGVKSMIGGGLRTMIVKTLEHIGKSVTPVAVDRLCSIYVAHYLEGIADHTIIYPGVEETLDQLTTQGMHMSICTNKPHDLTIPVLNELGLDKFFMAVSCGDTLPYQKPDARHVALVLREMNCEKSGAVFVGDSEWDVEAARNFGIPVIAVSYGYSDVPLETLSPDAVIARFDELPAAITKIAR